MNHVVKAANSLKLLTIAKNLEKRGMQAFCCETAEEARQKVLSFIKDGASVSWGGSVTLHEIGIFEAMQGRALELIDAFGAPDPSQDFEQKRKSLMTDYFLMSANAITMDGQLVNIDGTGNRTAAMIFGPKEVIVVVGANKIVESEQDAVARIKVHACPPNGIRLKKQKTSCAISGKCGNCMNEETMCCHTVTTRYNRIPGRIKVVLVNEELGY